MPELSTYNADLNTDKYNKQVNRHTPVKSEKPPAMLHIPICSGEMSDA